MRIRQEPSVVRGKLILGTKHCRILINILYLHYVSKIDFSRLLKELTPQKCQKCMYINISLYDKNSESDYFFFLHQNQNIFSATLGIGIFFRKKPIAPPPPWKLNGPSLNNLIKKMLLCFFFSSGQFVKSCRLWEWTKGRLRWMFISGKHAKITTSSELLSHLTTANYTCTKRSSNIP